MADDPTIRRIRQSRQKISAQYHHNVAELIAHYGALEQRYQHRMVERVPQDSHEGQPSEEGLPSDAMHETPKPLAGNF
jgi:hypothetical protein